MKWLQLWFVRRMMEDIHPWGIIKEWKGQEPSDDGGAVDAKQAAFVADGPLTEEPEEGTDEYVGIGSCTVLPAFMVSAGETGSSS